MKLILTLRKYFLGIRLKNKLMLSYIVFFFIPLCFFSIITFDSFSNILVNNVTYSVEKNYTQTFSFLTEKFNKIKKTSDIILTNEDVNNMFITNNYYSNLDNYYSMKKSMNFLGSFEDHDISRITLFLVGEQDHDLSYYFSNIDNIEDSKWYNTINTNGMNLFWAPSSYLNNSLPANVELDSKNYALIRRFYNPTTYSSTLGYYCIFFRSKPIEEIVNMGDAINGSVTFLENSKGELIYASNNELYKNLYSLYMRRGKEKELTSFLKMSEVGDENIIYVKKPFADSDWNLITIISNDDILSQVRSIQKRVTIFTLILSIICFTFAWMLAHSLTKRIMQLQNKMKQVQHGNFNSKSNNPFTDEIGYLTNTYDLMMSEIESLMNERYKAGIQAKTAELKVLQEQIDPHFLYNTLDTINWLTKKGNYNEVEKAISSLAQFYKLGLSKGNDEIPLQDELKRIENYVEILNIRFSKGINLVIDIDDEIGNYLALKLILQPFVENSILHGIMKNRGKEGFILIEAVIEEENLKITIQDNGTGMSEKTLKMVNEETFDNKYNGYGIKNVRKRIKLKYGDQYKIKFTSTLGIGTTVIIVIPAKYNDI